jgi:AcrR family transcriptional regulator
VSCHLDWRYRPRVPERDAGGDGQGRELPRLPPGRHGLDRDFVTKNQRDRLTAGIIAVVAEQGYREATVSRICAAAGVSRRTFYSYFSSKEECYVQAFDLVADFIEETLNEVGTAETEWLDRVRARLRALLEIFAANPALVSFMVIAPLRAGEEIADRHRRGLERMLSALTEGRAEAEDIREPSPTVEHALVGGAMALIAGKVENGEGTGLPNLLPELVELLLTAYIGRDRAVRVARRET